MTTTRQQELAALFDPATRADPYPALHAMRVGGPFSVLDGAVTVVGEYRRCAAILRDPGYSSDRSRSLLHGSRSVTERNRPRSFLSMDAPDHTRLRRLVSKAFTARVVAELEPAIRHVTDELFADLADAGSCDIVRQLAYPLPVRIISELLGVPQADHELFEGWSRRLVRGLDPVLALTNPAELADIQHAQAEFGAYFTELIARRRTRPGEDLLSRLVLIEEQGDQLSEPELIATCVLLLVAGHETTANLIANGVLALLRHPDQLAALRADPALISSTVEEVLRYDCPVQLTSRIVRHPTVIGDVEVPADGMLMLLLAAANRDPEVFDAPDRFDITREARQHLAFAAGAHFCLGAGLARLEAAVALSAFAQRIIRPELDERSLAYRPHINLRGPDRLLVGYAAVSAA